MAKQYVIRDRKIYARISYVDSSGKERQLWRRAQSKSQAKQMAQDLARDIKQSGTESFEHELTVNEYLEKWLKSLRLSERSIFSYETLLRLYVRPFLGSKKLSSVRPLDVQGLIDTLNERGFSSNTVRRTHVVFSRSLKQAVRWRLITFNPAHDVQLPKLIKREMKTLTPQEAQQFLAEAANDKCGLIFEVALWTGMRPEEYLGLKWEDLNLNATPPTITVKRAMLFNKQRGGWYFKPPKTAQSRRTITIPRHLAKRLSDHRKTQLEERLKAGERYESHNLVFATSVGSPYLMRNLDRRHYKPILQRANLPNIRVYDLRHTCATLLLAAGENPKVVAERLGHASVVLTLDTYSHVLPSMQQAATEKLEKLLRRK